MMHSPGFDGSGSLSLQMLMNADSLYTAAHCALLLNLKLSHGDYYRKRPALAPAMIVSARSRPDPAGRPVSRRLGVPATRRWASPAGLWRGEGGAVRGAVGRRPATLLRGGKGPRRPEATACRGTS